MSAKTRWTVKCRTPGIIGPLFGSAAGHLAFLGAMLLLGTATGQGAGGAFQVDLVDGAMFAPSESGRADSASGGRAPRALTARRGAAGAPRRPPSSAAPVEPPPGPVEISSRPQTAKPADDPALQPVVVPGSASHVTAALSGGRPSLSTARFGAVSALPEPQGGMGLPAGGAGGDAPGKGSLPGIATTGPSGGAGTASLAGTGVAGPPLGGTSGGRDGAEIRLLRERIESRIDYPEEAIRRGQEGEVLLRIRIGEGGVPQEIRVARSSGARTLDEAARNGVVRAAPLPSLPGWFEVPIMFSLR
ncbi:MAG TPA: energy transducer TonB [Candidatus Limnocylindrales bacterium]|nr:energy transducer TonB [Candidatus Limnocylindrales bacterium]